MGSPNCKDIKIPLGEVYFRGTPHVLRFLGVWMTFKKAAMAKTLRNGLIMSEMGLPITNGWILRFSWDWHCTSFKKTVIFDQWPKLNLGFDVQPEITILKVI